MCKFVALSRVMAIGGHQNFVSLLYLENKQMDFDPNLCTH